MSEDASDIPAPGACSSPRRDTDAAVLPFPSNRPLEARDARVDDAQGRPGLREVIGDVLRDERHRQERTLADVAGDSAVSLPYLSEVERGRKEVSSDLLDAIGNALELPLVEILERAAERLHTEFDQPTSHRSIEMSTDAPGRSGRARGQRSICFKLAA